MKDEKCKYEGYSSNTWNRNMVKCKFKASTEAGYCKRHDPERIKAKSDARTAKWKAEWADIAHKRRINEKKSEALEVVEVIAGGGGDALGRCKAFMAELQKVVDGEIE